MDFKGWSKIKEDKDITTFKHPKGHTMSVAHKGLPKIQREQLKRLPLAEGGSVDKKTLEENSGVAMYNDGDYVEPSDSPANQADSQTSKRQQVSDSFKTQTVQSSGPSVWDKIVSAVTPSGEPANAAQSKSKGGEIRHYDEGTPAVAPISQTPAQQSFQPAIQTQIPTNPTSPAIGTTSPDVNSAMVQGFKEYAQGLGQQAEQDNQNKQMMGQATQRLDDYITKNPIDEKHLIENMGVGEKVATAIGLIFGSAAQGFTHGAVGNAASDYLHQQIDRDIQAQRDRYGQQQTIYGAYKDLFGDNNIATSLSKASMLTRLNNKLALAASQQGTPQAQTSAAAEIQKNNIIKDQATGSAAKQVSAIQNSGQAPPPTSFWDRLIPGFSTAQPNIPKQKFNTSLVSNLPKYIQSEETNQASEKQQAQKQQEQEKQDQTVPEVPVPQFHIDQKGINNDAVLQQQGIKVPGHLQPEDMADAKSEIAKANAANQKLQLIHQNFGKLWQNRSASNQATQYLSGLGVNLGGAHLATPDMTSWKQDDREYFRAAATIENELASLVGQGGLTEAQANTIRTKLTKPGDTPEEYKNTLKSIDANILSTLQLPILEDRYKKITRPKISE